MATGTYYSKHSGISYDWLKRNKPSLILLLGGFVFGIDAGIISGTVKFIQSTFALSDIQLGLIVSSPSLGAILALIFAGKFADKFGRKTTFITIASLYVVSAVMSVIAYDFYSLFFARALGGAAFCSLGMTSMYIGEISLPEERGKLVTGNTITLGLGFCFAYLANYLLVINLSNSSLLFSPEHIWRLMFAVELIPAVIWLVLIFSIPESPRWLAIKGAFDEGKEILVRYYGESLAHQRMTEIRQNLAKYNSLTFSEQLKVLFSKRMSKVLIIGVMLGVFQSTSGMSAIAYYTPMMLEQVGVGSESAFLQAALIGVFNVIATIFAIYWVDRLGRRPLLIVGMIVLLACNLVAFKAFDSAEYVINSEGLSKVEHILDTQPLLTHEGATFSNDTEFKDFIFATSSLDRSQLLLVMDQIIEAFVSINPYVIIGALVIFNATFSISLGPIMWVLFSEISPNAVRTVSIPIFACMTSVSAYVVSTAFPWQLNNWGASYTFLSYGCSCLLGLVFIYFTIPETKNKTLEQIEEELI